MRGGEEERERSCTNFRETLSPTTTKKKKKENDAAFKMSISKERRCESMENKSLAVCIMHHIAINSSYDFIASASNLQFIHKL